MKTMRKLQVAAAAASLCALAGVAQAATLNSSGSQFAAEAVFPVSAGVIGNNTRVKAPAFTYAYEGGVNAGSRQKFKIAVNLTNGAQWARQAIDPTRTDPFLPFFQVDGRQARTIVAIATVNGFRGRVAVLDNTDPPTGQFAIRLNLIEPGDTIGGSPLVSSITSAVTYSFEVVNNTPNAGINLEQLALTFSIYKPDPATLPAGTFVPLSATDIATTAIDQYPFIYNLASLSVDTATPACLLPSGAVRLQAVSGNNDPALLSQEDFQGNGGALRDVAQYILFQRATRMDLTKAGDRLIQTTNSFQTNLGSTPVNGTGGTGGGRTTFKPTATQVATVYGGNQTGLYVTNNTGASGNTIGRNPTFPERQTTGDERAAKLGTLAFSNLAGPLDRLNDLDPYNFHNGTTAQLANNANDFQPSDVGGTTRVVGDFTPVAPPISTNGNIFGGVDINTAPITAVPLSGALVIQFLAKANAFAPNAILTLQPGNAACADAVPAGALTPDVLVVPNASGTLSQYYWRFSHDQLRTAAGGANGTLAGNWSICYNVNGETTIPAATFTQVAATLLKDDTTEQRIVACSAALANVYGGVKVDVRNFQLHDVTQIPGTAADKAWSGILRIINNSEIEPATVEAQFIHDDGRYGPYGVLGSWNPREARYVGAQAIYDALQTPVANVALAPASVNNTRPTIRTTRLRISADVSTIRVQNYIFNSTTQALTEVSSAQGADFANIDSSNRDHIDQDAQFDIVKDLATLGQFPTTALKANIIPTTSP